MFLAYDLGTTTLAARLLDERGGVLAEAKRVNPQAPLGADVIRRLEASRAGKTSELQALLVSGMMDLAGELCVQAGVDLDRIRAAAAAANPGITTLLRGLDVDAILFPPHRPKDPAGVFLEPGACGLQLPVSLYLFPLVSGYVGGDLVAFLHAFEFHEPGSLYIDIGTNGEMALFDGQRWWTTSVAAGPAFEGGEISGGMAAGPGAISGVSLAGDRLVLSVIGGGTPRGICGSGLAEAVAAALDGGLLDRRGSILDPLTVESNLSRVIVQTSSGRALRLYRDARIDLLITQKDIRNFQLAKGAIRAGVQCLLGRAGLGQGGVTEVWVTGAFGFSLGRDVLKRVAMLPENMLESLRFMTAGALGGVGRMLLQDEGSVRVQSLAACLKPYPLSGTPAFEEAFLHALDF